MTCELNLILPLSNNILVATTNAEIESDIGVWNDQATYSIGDVQIFNDSVWYSKEDNNKGNPPFLDNGSNTGRLLSPSSSVTPKKYVYDYHLFHSFKGRYPKTGEFVNNVSWLWHSNIDNNSTAPPTNGVSNAAWTNVGARKSFLYTRTNITEAYKAGDEIFDVSQNIGFIVMRDFPANSGNYFPRINDTTRAKITEASKWEFLRKTNPYLILDESPYTQTIRAETLEITITANRFFDSIALLNMEGLNVEVVAKAADTGVESHNQTHNLREPYPNEFQNWTKPVRFNKDVVIDGLINSSPNMIITIKINAPNAIAKLGKLIIGTKTFAGTAVYDPSVRIDAYLKDGENKTHNYLDNSYSVGHAIKTVNIPISDPPEKHVELVNLFEKVMELRFEGIPIYYRTIDESFSILGYLQTTEQFRVPNGTKNKLQIRGLI